ncbi:MAG: glycosyltransferase family 4 protein [Candidatus Hermodarchaeota archaeon]
MSLLNQHGFLTRELTIPLWLRKKNIDVSFLTFGNKNDLNFSKLLNGINVIPVLDFINFKSKRLKFLKSLLIPIKFREQIKSIDIVRTDQLEGSWIAIIIKLLFKKKLIIRVGYEKLKSHILRKTHSKMNSFKYWINYLKIYFLEFVSYKLADRIILTNPFAIDFIIKTFRLRNKNNKIKHISNFVDTSLFRPLNIAKLDNHVLFIGRLNKEKNLVNLIKAFTDLKGFTLDLIGQGGEKEIFMNLAKELKVDANFLGVISHNELPQILNQYRIAILPSYREGNPKVLLEAMSCGIACIGTNVWGIKNIIDHNKTGIICETDSKSIRNAILALNNDELLMKELGYNAREFILKNVSLNTIIRKELSLYKSFSS